MVSLIFRRFFILEREIIFELNLLLIDPLQEFVASRQVSLLVQAV